MDRMPIHIAILLADVVSFNHSKLTLTCHVMAWDFRVEKVSIPIARKVKYTSRWCPKAAALILWDLVKVLVPFNKRSYCPTNNFPASDRS